LLTEEKCEGSWISTVAPPSCFTAAPKEPKVREEYLQKLDAIRKGRFIKVGSIEDFKKMYAY